MLHETDKKLSCWYGILALTCLPQKTRKILFALGAILILVLLAFFMRLYKQYYEIIENDRALQPPLASRPPLPTFAYIGLTEKCLPMHWMKSDHLGDPALCNCDVYVLSYRQPCDRNSSHIFYLTNTSVGWTAGRNLGYFAARKRGYLYYIFFDDDITLTYNEYTPKALTTNKIPPLRIFANYLLEDLPAAAGVDYDMITPVNKVLRKWHCHNIDVQRMIPHHHSDALFIAYHEDAAIHLFPVCERTDRFSFWVSQHTMMFQFQMIFYGRLEFFPIISAHNNAHRYNEDNHQRFLASPIIRKEIVEKIREKTPAKYKNHPRFSSMLNMDYRKERVAVLCWKHTEKRTPIIPYQNMNPPKHT